VPREILAWVWITHSLTPLIITCYSKSSTENFFVLRTNQAFISNKCCHLVVLCLTYAWSSNESSAFATWTKQSIIRVEPRVRKSLVTIATAVWLNHIHTTYCIVVLPHHYNFIPHHFSMTLWQTVSLQSGYSDIHNSYTLQELAKFVHLVTSHPLLSATPELNVLQHTSTAPNDWLLSYIHELNIHPPWGCFWSQHF
jgi:hypothetical protein